MKKLVDTLGAVLTVLCLCMMPARADVMSPGLLAMGVGGVVVIVAVAAIACSLLIRAIRKRRNNRK